MGLTLRQAAEMCGRSRSTIHRALKSGKLSGGRDESGAWAIDPAELSRVFPPEDHGPDQRDAAELGRAGAETLAVKVEMLERQLEREKETIDDLRTRLDRAEERVFALSAPLTPQTQEAATQRGLWGRLRDAFRG